VNLNGIRSAAGKNLFRWLARQKADIVCVQELKAQAQDMTADMLAPRGFRGYFHYAEKKGYSGVGIYTRREPDRVIAGLGVREFDAEGRYLRADFGKLSVVSVYLPSGSSGEHRQKSKFRFMEQFHPHLAGLIKDSRQFIVCGDWNIAHKEIDLRNWRGNRKNSGFLPEERQWLTRVFDELSWVDVFRRIDPRRIAYVVVKSRAGKSEERRVAHRLPDRDPSIAGMARTVRSTRSSVFRTMRR
jgi:exodeoxyribonuclease-3